mgnify:CR=1 FL=1
MGLFDKAKSIFGSSNESEESAESKLGKVTEKDHLNSIIKEREDLCRQLFESETSETVKRDGEKIGRNDPCPCGSGKKYKKCCGKKH